jgi:ATP-binding cassette subfamily A (ABC1) protein 3
VNALDFLELTEPESKIYCQYLFIQLKIRTTTLEILAGDIFPTKGGATLGGFDIMSQQLQVRRLIGYCPQFDAIFSLLTATEHLELFARIKGVKEQNLKKIVDGMLHYLSLEEYANRPAGTYSGGNKRKLCVAMALIGDPAIVFLDGNALSLFQIG